MELAGDIFPMNMGGRIEQGGGGKVANRVSAIIVKTAIPPLTNQAVTSYSALEKRRTE